MPFLPEANHDQYKPKEPNYTESFSKRSLLGVRRDCPCMIFTLQYTTV
jgi:hypothetical protein